MSLSGSEKKAPGDRRRHPVSRRIDLEAVHRHRGDAAAREGDPRSGSAPSTRRVPRLARRSSSDGSRARSGRSKVASRRARRRPRRSPNHKQFRVVPETRLELVSRTPSPMIFDIWASLERVDLHLRCTFGPRSAPPYAPSFSSTLRRSNFNTRSPACRTGAAPTGARSHFVREPAGRGTRA